MSDALSILAPHFFQVAYVVPDLARAEAWFERVLGVNHFERLEGVVLGDGCRHRGAASNGVLDLSLGYLGDTQLELVRPAGGVTLHGEFLETGGRGLHHVAFAVPDFAAATARLTAELGPPAADGVLAGGMRVEFAYYECTEAGASFVEVLGFDEAARAFMSDLKEKSRRATARR
ncbi:MAG: hypothetical protein FJ144_10750 [Deltaproteobacteria bacterium]|nr:hypothetical protein [Deltaproteobacteria bacterium]